MNSLERIMTFARFTLVEYARSGRVLIEVITTIAAFVVFFFNHTIDATYFFSTAGVLSIILTFYTTSSIMGLGDRPQGYVLLGRKLGRTGYLLGLYTAALLVELAAYGVLSLGVALLNPVAMDIGDWLLGSLPLILNMALLGALLTLLTPLVLTPGWRLLIMGILALAFSGNLIGGPTLATMWPPLSSLLNMLRTVFSTPLLPAFTGFALSASRDYSGTNAVIPLAQLLMIVGLLSLSIYAFSRRDIVLTA